MTPELQGRKGVYEVEVVEVKEKVMPAFDDALTDDEMADLVMYLRTLTDKPPWPDVAAEVKRASKGEG